MENKSNSLNRIKRHQREKVLRFSIRKYSFGAASVAVAALMFLGARVVSADTVSGSNSQSTAGVVQPNDKGNSPVGIKEPTENKSEVVNSSLENKETALVENSSNTVDKSQLRTVVEELNSLLSTKLNLDDSVLSSVKERVQRAQALLDKADAVQKDINELKELLSTDLATLSNAVKESSEVRESNTGTEAEKPASQPSSEVRASEENQTVSAKKDSLKVSVDQLKVAISEVPEHDTTKKVLEKANEVMVLAQGVLQNTTVSLTDVEQMNKLVKQMFISVKNATTRLSSGSHDPRNGKRMARGTGERAATVSSTWTTQDNQLIYQRFRAVDGNGTVRNDDRRFTENKVDMTGRIETIGGVKYAVYDIFFNNDGKAMAHQSKYQTYRFMLQPKILDLASSGLYNPDTIRDLSFEIYRRNNPNEGGTLSQNPEKFHRERVWNAHFINDNEKTQNGFTYLNTVGVRAGRSHAEDMKDIFKKNNTDPYLEKAVKLEGNHSKYSYGLGLKTEDKTAAVHMHLKAKLRSGVTEEDVRQAFTIAVASTFGLTTNQSYVFGSGKEAREHVEPTVKQSTKYPISGKEVTKKVDEPLGNLDRPVDAGFITRNNNFPADVHWSWPSGKPSTTTAGVFRYKVKAQYSDNTSNTTDATLKVVPKQPVIDQNSVNEKAGKTEQTVTVNVGNGVPKDSIVTLYSGNTVIGTGKTNGTTATIKVSKALPSTAITARTSVQNSNGKVESELSAPVTPTPERDTQPPTVKMTNPTNNREFVLGSSENNSPEVEVFRGATLDIPLKMHDNNANGKINIKHISGLPKGVNLNNGNTLTTNSGSETKPATATISGRVATDAHLGTNVVTLKASDDATGNVDKGNQSILKFKVKTYDLAFEDRGTPINDNTRSDVLGLKQRSADPNHYLTTTDGTNKGDGNFGADMKFRYLKGNEISEHVSFDKIGKYDVKARAYFPNSKTSTKGLPTNPTTGLTGDTASVAGRGFLEKTIEFNVKPNTPTLAQEQFYGTASSRPSVTVGNLPTSDQLQNGSNVTVELYQGTTKIASKTVTDRNGTTTLSAGDFTANLREGQPVHAVVKVSGGQNATAYSVTSDNSANRNVTGRSEFAQPANKIVQIKKGNLSEEEKTAIKNAIFEANKNGILRGKTVNDVTITDAGVIRAVDKDNKVAELEVNPTTGVVTRYAHIRDDYNLTFKNNGILANRPTDKGFEWSQDGKSLIYKFDATKGTPLPINDILNTITANPKNPDASGQPSLTVVNGSDKVAGERTENGYKHEGGFFYHNNKPVNVLDIVRDNFAGGGTVDNSANKLVETNRSDVNDRNIVGTNLEKGTTTIPVSNGAGTVTINTPVVKAKDGSSLIVKRKLYLMPKWTDAALLAERNTTLENNTNVINLYFVPVDPIKPEVARSNSNTLATSSNQATRLAENTSFTSLVKVTDNYDKDDTTNATTNTVRSKLNMWVKTGNTKTLIVENGVEKTDVITRLKKEVTPATYEVFAKTTDASGNKSHEDTSDGASLGFFKVGYNLVARQTINVVRGETLTQAELNKLVQVREGNTLQDLPQGATVTAALETASIRSGKEETKTVEATVNFGENRTQKVTLTYKVLNTFPIARKLYDFKNPDTARSGGSSVYYHNGGTIPDGMTWIYKVSDNVAQPGDKFTEALAKDPVGTTNYKFGGKYDYSRNTNRPTTTGNLEYTETVVHEVFDVGANTTRVMVKSGTALADSQAKDAVMAVNGSAALPNGTTYEWVNQNGTPLTNKTVTEKGEAVRYVKVTLPKTAEDGPAATQHRSSKIVRVTINESEKPKVSFNGSELSKDASNENSKFVIFRGATFNPTFTVSDNSGKVTEVKASGLPSGREFVKNTDTPNGNVQITGNDITATSNASLGDHIGKVLVKDASGNEQEYQFKYTVVDVEAKNTPETVTLGTKLVDTANSRNGKDAHGYVKAVVESNSTGNDKYYPTNMSFKWSKDGNIVENTTTFDTSGIVKYKAVADFYGAGGVYTKTVEGIGNNIKIYAPDKIEREVTFKVQPIAPTISQWQNGNLKVTPTTDHDKVTIPLKDGSVTLVKKATGWEVETPKEGVIVRGDSVEIPKELLGTTITAQGTKGTGDSAVDSENARPYTLLSHTVSKAEIIKKPTDTIATTDLSGTTGITGITDNNVNKTYSNAGITSVGFTNGTPTLTPDSEQNVPVTITYNDGSKETVDVTLKVAPAAPNVTVNKQDEKTGDVTLTIKRHDNSNYPNDSVVAVPGIDGTFKVKDGTITIKNDQLKDKVQTGKVTVTEGTKLPAETIDDKQIPAKLVESATPIVTKEKQEPKTGDVTYKVTTPSGDYPEGSTVTINGKDYTVGAEGKVTVPNNDLPTTVINDAPTSAQEKGKLPKAGNTVEVPVKLISSKGQPESQEELPEFNGGVNGELPDPVELPKVKLIITKWIDEQGNELKPADAKAPAVLGEANEALEAGEIEGYVFVRTDVNEEGDVVTHVFRKVTPTKPEGNGEQQGGDNTPQPTPEVPTDNRERKPETEKPTVPDTKQAEQSTQTVDAQVAPSQNQAVLPNTGSKADRATGALGALSLLGAFGLLFAKKKKDDEEETRNN